VLGNCQGVADTSGTCSGVGWCVAKWMRRVPAAARTREDCAEGPGASETVNPTHPENLLTLLTLMLLAVAMCRARCIKTQSCMRISLGTLRDSTMKVGCWEHKPCDALLWPIERTVHDQLVRQTTAL
jgi:hypothetical protein